MTPTLANPGTSWCTQCDRRYALIPTNRPNVLLGVEFAPDGYTATDRRHVCAAQS